MIRLKNPSGWGRLSALLLIVAVVLIALTQIPGQGKSWAKDGNWKNVTLIYTTDIKGKIEPCG